MFPDTIDPPERARLAVNCLSGCLDPARGHLPFCLMDVSCETPRMRHPRFHWSDHVARVIDRWSWLRQRLGWDGEVLEAMESARKQTWWRELPVLGVMAIDDARIDGRSLDFVKRSTAHQRAEIFSVSSGGHMVHQGEHKPKIEEKILQFIQKN